MFGDPFSSMSPSVSGGAWESVAMAGAAGVFGILMVIYFFVLFVSFIVSVASYVLHSLGLYTIAKRRGINNSWLAWIPVGSVWMLGSVSDQYQYVVKGKIKNRRLVLMWMHIALLVVCFVWFVLAIVSAFNDVAAGSAIGVILAMLVCAGLSVTMAVFQYLAYYDLFVSCSPKNGVLFLVLSIVFPITLPFFVFACWKKDEGMPPRKKTPPMQLEDPMKEESGEAEELEQPAVPEEEPATEEGYAQPEEFEET